MDYAQYIKPLRLVLQREFKLLRAFVKGRCGALQQLPLQGIQVKLHLSVLGVIEVHSSVILYGVGGNESQEIRFGRFIHAYGDI